jgi:hypothetical protein
VDIFLIHFGVPFGKMVELYGDYSIMTTQASMNNIVWDFDPSQIANLPLAQMDFSMVNNLSNIDVRRDNVTVGVKAALSSGLLLNLGYQWNDYEDRDPILDDQTGNYQVIYGSVGWNF